MAKETNMILYQFEGCPYCTMVREKLSEIGDRIGGLGLKIVYVPYDRAHRKDVIKVSGQPLVPVLVDGKTVLDDEEKIIPYLEKNFGK